MNQKGLAAMLTSTQSSGVGPEVNLRITQARKYTKGIHPGLEMSLAAQSTGVSVVPRKGLMSSKNCSETIAKRKKTMEKLQCLLWNMNDTYLYFCVKHSFDYEIHGFLYVYHFWIKFNWIGDYSQMGMIHQTLVTVATVPMCTRLHSNTRLKHD